ncbi:MULTISPECIES: 2-phosphosulfolactate phosphatase [Cytobacillus]|uniref:Probable 2-phosphosulfolactate phosphatase n=1 Tax=Cytobacillus kochii TaxID=859143 RepID=A0A248TNR1_9BACI|nr:2-phosphosulfolactate phosphatase [Cytobacillus kochii]ASV69863.1 hypothetical protein CKF48_22645 [Cytobacillus kochii]
MVKLHVVMKKEEIDKEKLNGQKVVVVFDILMATSVITTAIQHGAKAVIPVANQEDALYEASIREKGTYVLVGEYNGLTIDGFESPHPERLSKTVEGKDIILTTTNGTVAIKHALNAKKVYIASLLNAKHSAKAVCSEHLDETVVLVCSGSSGVFNVEDFYGVGYYIDCLITSSHKAWEMSDTALCAHQFYLGAKEKGTELLMASRVGKMIANHGMKTEVAFVAQKDIFAVSPIVTDEGVIGV